jgi:hypothetical protein
MNTLAGGQDVSGQLPCQNNATGDHLRAVEHISNAPGDDAQTFKFGVDSEATGDHPQACGSLSKTFARIVCFIRDS